jgi:hypothetical protein
MPRAERGSCLMNRSAPELRTGTARVTLTAAGGAPNRNPEEAEPRLGLARRSRTGAVDGPALEARHGLDNVAGLAGGVVSMPCVRSVALWNAGPVRGSYRAGCGFCAGRNSGGACSFNCRLPHRTEIEHC